MTVDERLRNVAPGAREFLAAGLASLDHACSHARQTSVEDAAQVVLSLAHGVEMLSKGVLLHRGETIYERGNWTISLRQALDKIGKVRQATSILVLVDRRDGVQHAAAYMDPARIQDYFGVAREFVGDLLGSIGVTVEICPEQVAIPRGVEPREATLVEAQPPGEAAQQRDASYGGGLLVWAQGTGALRVRIKREGDVSWLSPADAFEYMPHTDGRHIATYRQSGGIVVYEPAIGRREVVSETGGPGAVKDGIIAAQGIGVPNGLAGGVWLLTTDGAQVDRLSEAGDSPRLSGHSVVWEEYRNGEHLILARPINGGDEQVLVRGGRHPALHDDLLSWTGSGLRPAVYARDLATGQEKTLSEMGIFPDVRNGLITFLEQRGDRYDLRVLSWPSGRELVRAEDVGFPIGRGPILIDSEVVWESKAGSSDHRLWQLALPNAPNR